MSSPCHTSSPHECCLAKTKAPEECMEEEWHLVLEDELDPMLSNDEKMRWDKAEKRAWEEAKHLAKRRAEEECKVQEVAARAKEETKREEAAWRANTKRRALEERLWEMVGQHSEMAVAPLQVAKPSGRMMVAGPSAPAWKASGV
ncbi:hypothetical protein ID866_12303 [Astraeus odoratus]|nr:hypothetical protein ID866_12303 [Astraeus odoratus]